MAERVTPFGASENGAGRAENTRSPGPSPLRALALARTASLPRAGGRHLPLWGGAPSLLCCLLNQLGGDYSALLKHD